MNKRRNTVTDYKYGRRNFNMKSCKEFPAANHGGRFWWFEILLRSQLVKVMLTDQSQTTYQLGIYLIKSWPRLENRVNLYSYRAVVSRRRPDCRLLHSFTRNWFTEEESSVMWKRCCYDLEWKISTHCPGTPWILKIKGHALSTAWIPTV